MAVKLTRGSNTIASTSTRSGYPVSSLGWNEDFVAAQGCTLVDAAGRRFLDMSGCFGAVSVGHHHPALDAALVKLLSSRQPCTLPFGIPDKVGELAASLCALADCRVEKAYFCSSGAEEVEAAMKFAMIATGRSQFVAFQGGYHGLTLGALGLQGPGPWREPLPAVPFSARIAAHGDLAQVEAWLTQGDVAAVVIEVIQGVGGGIEWTADCLASLKTICARHQAILILDEVLTGMGRTGHWFAFQGIYPDLDPDILVTSKGLSGGVIPVGAVLMTDDVYDRVYGPPGRANVHGSTMSANAMAVTTALTCLDILQDQGLLRHAVRMGRRLSEGLAALRDEQRGIYQVRGRGLMVFAGISGDDGQPDPATAFYCCHALREADVIVTVAASAPAYLKLTPPLIITEAEVDCFLQKLSDVLTELGD